MKKEVMEIRENLELKLNPARYEHSLSVSFICIALAMKYQYDLEKAEMAGLLHDCAKQYDNQTIIEICNKQGIELTKGELKAPAIIHAKLGAYMAQNEYQINDPEILSAIACHTTGKPEMKLLDKILYIADFIEPRRKQFPNLQELRSLAFEDLDETLFQIMEMTLNYLEKSTGYADYMTKEAYEYYKRVRFS